MKPKRGSRGGYGHGGSKSNSRDPQSDRKEKSHFKAFGDVHPVNDKESNLKVRIVKENDNDSENDSRKRYFKSKDRKNNQEDKILENVESDEIVENPFQTLLTDLDKDASLNKSINNLKRKINVLKAQNNKKNDKKIKVKNNEKESELTGEGDEVDSDDETDTEQDSSEEEDQEIEIDESGFNTYAQEVLCKDNLETKETTALDQFTLHFEKNLENKAIDTLKTNLKDRSVLSGMEQSFEMPALGPLKYSPVLEETKVNLRQIKTMDKLNIKQRMLDRMNESIKTNLQHKKEVQDENEIESPNSKYNLDKTQLEILNVISSYSDFYHSNVDVKYDSDIKFTYAIHALNHVLKTRSRIIAHNDKIKQNKSNKTNNDIEHRDQGLTRPKVLIVVPFRKCALKLIKTFISLIMRKSEEYVSNKKRFFDSFGPIGEDITKVIDENGEEIKKERADDHNFLFTGNVEDHFKIGMSISKKSLKLYTEFYSSDIIIASPLGLKSVISGLDGEGKIDYDFLSSLEVLIVDNADVLMMQNWDHVVSIFEHLHLQPKKSHDVDFSRVRNWLLDGHSRFYRQTLIFSQIPAPSINSVFNKYCQNYAGKCQINLMQTEKYQTGSICRIGFQLAQMFHKIECDSPVDLPEARFSFFIEKILPQFKDTMMEHTLIFIPSYFDFVKIRNYFKKNDMSSMHCSEYMDKKSIDRARYLFYHGRVHFMLLTERFHFYNRYKIRGITNIIFYELPHYPIYYSNFCNYLPDVKRKTDGMDNFTATVLYSDFDAQKLCAIVGQERTSHMINSPKNVHMFMTDDN